MLNEWDGTPWGGTPVKETKAEVGPGVGFYGPSSIPLQSIMKSPQQMMKRAQAAYHTNPWIRSAEAAVTRRVVGLPWHLEDDKDEEFENPTGLVKVVQTLLEKPQANLVNQRQMTRRELWAITSRHLGLCGMAFWYLDQVDSTGLPASILYINPARMWPAQTENGVLTGWILDPKDNAGNGGTPLSLQETLTFYLDPPDWGNMGSGLYEVAVTKAMVTGLADQHGSYVLGTGGRIAGIISPKTGTIEDEQFKTLLNEVRNVNEAPDAAKRTTIMQGPVDFVPTAANPQELDLIALSQMNRDDIFTIWGVPASQAPVAIAAGMNSGDTKGYDEAILMQGSVHDRVVSIEETIQYQLLDKLATVIELEVVEPEFDDDAPKYEIASKAVNHPLTNEERRALTGHPPFGDGRDTQVLLPSTITALYEKEGDPEPPPPPPPALAPFAGVVPGEVPDGAPAEEPPAKAGRREFLGLRKSVETRWIPSTRKRVEQVLELQKREVAAKLRASSPAVIERHRNDAEHWLPRKQDDRMLSALRPSTVGIAEVVTSRVRELLGDKPGKGFADTVAQFISGLTGKRIKGINDTTRSAIADAISEGFALGLSPLELATSIEGLPAFTPYRAELVARTETMNAYNAAALESYREYDVTQVQAIDGDQDEACAARDMQVFSVDDASGIEDHPNGTLDWLPYFGEGKAQRESPTGRTAGPETSPQAVGTPTVARRIKVERTPDGYIVSEVA